MNIVNLTPHTINILRAGLSGYEEIVSIPKSGIEARLDVTRKVVGNETFVNGKHLVDPTADPMGGVVFFNSDFGEPTGLPAQVKNTIYIVSSLFRTGFDRPDLWVPGELIRDEEGKPIGCLGLNR